MKSILIGLLLMTSIPLSRCYSQTDSVYCIPIGKARALVADALKLRVADSLQSVQSARIALLESEYKNAYSSFTNLLKIEQEKLQVQKEITAHTESISNTYQEEKKALKKQVRRLKWQRAGMAALTVLVVAASL